jgi:hypothetical protein
MQVVAAVHRLLALVWFTSPHGISIAERPQQSAPLLPKVEMAATALTV